MSLQMEVLKRRAELEAEASQEDARNEEESKRATERGLTVRENRRLLLELAESVAGALAVKGVPEDIRVMKREFDVVRPAKKLFSKQNVPRDEELVTGWLVRNDATSRGVPIMRFGQTWERYSYAALLTMNADVVEFPIPDGLPQANPLIERADIYGQFPSAEQLAQPGRSTRPVDVFAGRVDLHHEDPGFGPYGDIFTEDPRLERAKSRIAGGEIGQHDYRLELDRPFINGILTLAAIHKLSLPE